MLYNLKAMSKSKWILLIVLVLIGVISYSQYLQKRSKIPFIKTDEIQTVSVINAAKAPRLSTVADHLEVPWALTFLPDRSILFTERPGRVRLIDKMGKLLPDPIATIDVKQIGEGGLMGITIHPKFSINRFVFIYYYK